MAYCRLSDKCDLYVYKDHAGKFIVIHASSLNGTLKDAVLTRPSEVLLYIFDNRLKVPRLTIDRLYMEYIRTEGLYSESRLYERFQEYEDKH